MTDDQTNIIIIWIQCVFFPPVSTVEKMNMWATWCGINRQSCLIEVRWLFYSMLFCVMYHINMFQTDGFINFSVEPCTYNAQYCYIIMVFHSSRPQARLTSFKGVNVTSNVTFVTLLSIQVSNRSEALHQTIHHQQTNIFEKRWWWWWWLSKTT